MKGPPMPLIYAALFGFLVATTYSSFVIHRALSRMVTALDNRRGDQ